MEVGALLAGKYRLVRLLGDGGMGAVYEARHENLGSNFAIKVLHADLARRPGLIERFLREAHVSAQIKSPHVVQVFDVDRTPPPDSVAYIVMELLGGEPLARVLDRERKLAPPAAVGFALQMLEALEAAHALGVVHRDLKPENVFLTPPPTPGAPPLLKLIDFGIAKLKNTDPQTKNLTAFGVVMGTPEYMAPEQAFSADRADARSDIYAVGVMLYEMLSGTRPALGDEAQVVAAKVHRGEVVPLVHAAPEVPRELAGLVHRAMAPRPELRFQSTSEMATALRSIAQHLTASANVPSPAGMGVMPSTMLAPPIAASSMPPPQNTGAGKTQPPDVQHAVSPGPPPYGYTPAPQPQISYPEDPYARARRKRRSPIGWIIGVPLVLGATAAAIVLGIQQASPPPTPAPTVETPTTPANPTATAISTTITTPPGVTTNAPLPALVPGQPATNRPPTTKPPVDAAASHDGSATQPSSKPSASVPPIFPPFPSTFPSTLPFPFPSGIPLPAGFPPIPSVFPFPSPPSNQGSSTQ